MSILENEKVKRRMPELINAITNTIEEDRIITYENIMLCILASPVLLFGSVLNFVLRYLVLHYDLHETLINSGALILLAFLFEFVSRIDLNPRLQTILVSALFVLFNIFIAVRIYPFNGHAYWLVIALQVIMALFRITKVPLLSIVLTTLFTALYIWKVYPLITFPTGTQYYLTLIALLSVLFVVGYAVNQITVNRYREITKKYLETRKQKEEITALYEELAATEEELRENNEQLILYNQQIEENQEDLKHLVYYDPLTELPNRKMIIEQLNYYIAEAKETKKQIYIVIIDLDNFKKVNDTMGHYMGDLLLQAVTERLGKHIHEKDTLGHIGGDEFAIIIDRDFKEEEIYQYIESIRKCLLESFTLKNCVLRTSASFGIAVYPKDGEETTELIKCADTSMYKAKDLGKNTIHFFKKGILEEIVRKTEMENKLISALQNKEFYLVFQPLYCLHENKIIGFEALLRWRSPDLGIVSPAQFIPLAEEIGLIIPLGEWVLKTACATFKKLQEVYNLDIHISVNISPVQIKDKNFLDTVSKILGETKLSPKFLHLEITESVFIESVHDAVKILKELKEMGLKIDLDDFGTGYSSLSYLKLLPIDTLKIDRSFIKDLAWNTPNEHIVGDIISLAHNLNVNVIAEGVEFEHQLSYLKKVNCDCVQGFLLGKPREENELHDLLTFQY